MGPAARAGARALAAQRRQPAARPHLLRPQQAARAAIISLRPTTAVAAAVPMLAVQLRLGARVSLVLWQRRAAARVEVRYQVLMVPRAREGTPTPAVTPRPMVRAARFLPRSRSALRVGILVLKGRWGKRRQCKRDKRRYDDRRSRCNVER